MKRYAIIGGSGSIGREMTRQLLQTKDVGRIVIYSRGEALQADMKQEFPEYPDNIMRYFIGDVRDEARLKQALQGIDCVIHAAAIKRVEVAEYDPVEAVKTNIDGTINVVNACNAVGVKKAILTSTDKAAAPCTLYGGTKFVAERVFIGGNNLGKCRFSVCRYANVIASRGSVVNIWSEQVQRGDPITITDSRMSRMWISKPDAADFVINKFGVMQGGEIFVPNLTGTRLIDTARQVAPEDHPIKEIGLRPSEKLHEVLITETDSRECYYHNGYYIIYPGHHEWTSKLDKVGNRMPEGFTLTSEVMTDD